MDIPINDDAIVEGTESFTVTLSAVVGPGNPQVDPLLSVATVFIIDNDGECNRVNQTSINFIFVKLLMCSQLL